jgi:hypothetical protein
LLPGVTKPGTEASLLAERTALNAAELRLDFWLGRIAYELSALGLGLRPNIAEGEDGSIGIEIALPDRRFGIALDPRDAESSWFIASKPEAGGTSACGLLRIDTLSQIIGLAFGDRARR